jgi:uncharacterized cofD-like protein
MAGVPLEIAAEVRGADPAAPDEVTTVRGQEAVALTRGRVQRIRLIPEDPPACDEAVAATLQADWVVLGPGSWFTSVLPHLRVPALARALCSTRARRLVSLNLAPQTGETAGFLPENHLEALAANAPEFSIDVVLADAGVVTDEDRLAAAAKELGARLVLAPVASADGSPRHDPELLATAYDAIFTAGGRPTSWR